MDGTYIRVEHGRALQGGRSSARLVLGARLRRLREEAGVSCEDAGRAIGGSGSKISRLEIGRTKIKFRDVEDLLALYGIADDAERGLMLALARHANAASWWEEYADVIPAWLEHYLELERAATLIRTYQAQVIPGLLQTEDYCRAVVRSGRRDAPAAEVERRVALRMARKEVLYRKDPVRLWAVIDEESLRRPVADTALMRAQVRHLIEIARLPHVNIQVLPLSASGYVAGDSGITMLRFGESELPDVVYLEHHSMAVYLTRQADTALYRDALNRLVAQANPPAAAAATLESMTGDGP